MNIKNLEAKITQAETLLDSKFEQLSQGSDFALELSISSLKAHVRDLSFQLKTEKEQRKKEVIELRLMGYEVDNGSVPLELLANLSKYFSGLITSASAKLKIGQDVSGVISSEITYPLNLRFADIAQGSSRLFITGDTSPDLFGESLLENSLNGLFELLNSDFNEGLSDQVHFMGLRSTHNLAEFLKVLRKRSIELELSWSAPNDTKHFWKGRRDKIEILEKLLDGFSASEPVNTTVVGVVELISRSGKLDIRQASDELVKVTYSKKLFEDVRKLRLGDVVRLDCKETTIFNSSTEEEKKKYSLLRVLWEH
ncbi:MULTISPECIES: hypothetical protein [Pseudoalteromonas]|jgi:hypothetical protein|uniref:S1 motif domain-containing protein n=1 Tax=Pseudoalteromonas neustonica TaxID=1840331 RepID=A0ABY3FDX3_9GAMM|nr:hypothetical protein [Pseudoalteromonas neustonica]TVU83599.1 hypothetical protein FQP85_10500 [Pseudoalteromonas neustonica]